MGMNPAALLAIAMVSATSGITCDWGTVYESGCATSSSVTEAYDCTGSYDQCYTWTYKISGGCNYQSKGCDLASSSWCGASYQTDTYTATCCHGRCGRGHLLINLNDQRTF